MIHAPRYVDKLVKVFTKAGTEEWILVHIEVQGYTDVSFAKRMFQYYYRILDQYDRPITAFAIFTGMAKDYPAVYERDFLGTGVRYWYNTYKIAEQNDDELGPATTLLPWRYCRPGYLYWALRWTTSNYSTKPLAWQNHY